MTGNLTALILAITIFAALSGWGRLVTALLLRWTGDRVESVTAAMGLGAVLALCGVANLLRIPNGLVLLALTVVGLAAFCFHLPRQFSKVRHHTSLREWVLPLLLIAVMLPLFVRGLSVFHINLHDDAYSYLLTPIQIQQTGVYRIDPFNFRMVVGNPGGLSYLQAGLLHVMDPRHISLLDHSVGLLLMLEALLVLARRHRLGWWLPPLVLAPVFIIDFPNSVNFSSNYLNVALLMAMYVLLEGGRVTQRGHVAAAALVATAMVAMKTLGGIYAAPVLASFLLVTVVLRQMSLALALRHALLALGIGSVVLISWLWPLLAVDSTLISLTWGTGIDDMNLATLWFLVMYRGAAWVYLPVLLVALLALWRTGKLRVDILAFSLAGIASALAVTVLTGAVALERYEILVLLPTLLLCGLSLLATVSSPRVRVGLGLLLGALTILYQPGGGNVATAAERAGGWLAAYPQVITTLAYIPPPLDGSLKRPTAAQESIPPGARALVWSNRPYRFDFRRNPLHVVDFPCAASPGGMPCRAGGGDVAAWLTNHGIRYLVYAYRHEAGFPAAMVQRRLQRPWFTPWQRALSRLVLVFHQRVAEMGRYCALIYSDPNLVVLDLGTCRFPAEKTYE